MQNITDLGQNIGDVLNSLTDNKELEKGRKLAKQTAWMHEGESGVRIADFMIQKAETLVSVQDTVTQEKSQQ